jgi:hypothetical protein
MDYRVKCEFASANCPERWLVPWLVIWIVVLSSSATFKSLALPMIPAIVYNQIELSSQTNYILFAWLLSLPLGIFRRHESVFFCMFDTVGIT